MTPWDVVAKAAEIASRLGVADAAIPRAWDAIWQGLRSEMPELDRRPVDPTDEAVDAARDAGIDRQAEETRKRLKELGATDTDPTGFEAIETDDEAD